VASVYLNLEKRFAFVEFKTPQLASAVMGLDGMEIRPGIAVKIKRPHDYSESLAAAFRMSAALGGGGGHDGDYVALDVSRLGIVSNTVPDGPNKIFIGGLHYHLREEQVMELLGAFGKIRAFHLVKNEPGGSSLGGPAAPDDAMNYSKGYCFVEYSDPSVTAVAIAGLNGMDLGGGKSLTARLAGERPAGASAVSGAAGIAGAAMLMTPVAGAAGITAPTAPTLATASVATAAAASGHKVPPPNHTVVTGYDVEELVDAALGRSPMPTTPSYFDPVSGIPLTRVVPALWSAAVVPTATSTLAAHPHSGSGGGPTAGLLLPPLPRASESAPAPPPLLQPSAAEVAAAVMAATAAAGSAPASSSTGPNFAGSSAGLLPSIKADSGPTDFDILPTPVLVLHNMVAPEDLATEEDHQALVEEVRTECAKFGSLKTILIPREGPGRFKVYLQYASVQDAQAARDELHDRQFGDSTVNARYYSESDFMAGKLL
jgi:hypothetical protein